MDLTQYTTNVLNASKKLANALIGNNTTENFQSEPTPKPYISLFFLISGFISIVCFLAYGYGAANLSYCLNKSLGHSEMESLLWAALAFVFNMVYYPYYGIFLNPVCASSARRSMNGGGRR